MQEEKPRQRASLTLAHRVRNLFSAGEHNFIIHPKTYSMVLLLLSTSWHPDGNGIQSLTDKKELQKNSLCHQLTLIIDLTAGNTQSALLCGIRAHWAEPTHRSTWAVSQVWLIDNCTIFPATSIMSRYLLFAHTFAQKYHLWCISVDLHDIIDLSENVLLTKLWQSWQVQVQASKYRGISQKCHQFGQSVFWAAVIFWRRSILPLSSVWTPSSPPHPSSSPPRTWKESKKERKTRMGNLPIIPCTTARRAVCLINLHFC